MADAKVQAFTPRQSVTWSVETPWLVCHAPCKPEATESYILIGFASTKLQAIHLMQASGQRLFVDKATGETRRLHGAAPMDVAWKKLEHGWDDLTELQRALLRDGDLAVLTEIPEPYQGDPDRVKTFGIL